MASSVWRTDWPTANPSLAQAAWAPRISRCASAAEIGWQCPFPPWRWIRATVPLRIVGCTAALLGSGMRAAATVPCPPGMPVARHSAGPFGHRPALSSGMYADAAAGCMAGSICETSSFVPPYLSLLYTTQNSALWCLASLGQMPYNRSNFRVTIRREFSIMSERYAYAQQRYQAIGVDTEQAIEKLCPAAGFHSLLAGRRFNRL